MTNESTALSKQPSESWNLVAKWVTLLGAHFRVELSEQEIRIYCESLQNENPDCLKRSMMRCLNECEFMPKLKMIRDRLPEPEKKLTWGEFVPVSETFEPFSATHHSHVFTDEHGYRRIRIEPITT